MNYWEIDCGLMGMWEMTNALHENGPMIHCNMEKWLIDIWKCENREMTYGKWKLQNGKRKNEKMKNGIWVIEEWEMGMTC